MGLRVWRLGTAAAEVQFRKLMSTLPGAKATDEVGDASFRAKSGSIAGLVYLVRERGVVVSMTCGAAQCTEPGQLVKLAKLVESRLPELPAEAPRASRPAPRRRPEDGRHEDGACRVPDGGRRAGAGACARAYDPATTHAGLTERAALASGLHRVLSRALSRPLGLFEPIALSLDEMAQAQAQSLEARLAALDPRRAAAPGPRRRRAGAGVGDRRLRHRHHAGGARPGFLLRPEPGGRAVAGGRLTSLGNTLGLLLDSPAACARCSPAPPST